MNVLVTGCCGFIGSHLVRVLKNDHHVTGVDKIADDLSKRRLSTVVDDLKEMHIIDLCMEGSAYMTEVDAIIHTAAETFVDTSISDPERFMQNNIAATFHLLEKARRWDISKIIIMSTDEVYGSLSDGYAGEDTKLCPGNPYSATKGAADMVAMAYANTYDMNITIVRPENNYGSAQSPEKAIPTWIREALRGNPIPVYGKGEHERMWLHVEDCCLAMKHLLEIKTEGIYNIGGGQGSQNIDMATTILDMCGRSRKLIKFIPDEIARPGHDKRYAIDTAKINATGWYPKHNIVSDLPDIIQWYKDNPGWLKWSK